jgi:hypothetical protein
LRFAGSAIVEALFSQRPVVSFAAVNTLFSPCQTIA